MPVITYGFVEGAHGPLSPLAIKLDLGLRDDNKGTKSSGRSGERRGIDTHLSELHAGLFQLLRAPKPCEGRMDCAELSKRSLVVSDFGQAPGE